MTVPHSDAFSSWPIALGSDEIAGAVAALAQRISEDHPDGLTLVGVAPGCSPLVSNLAEQIDVPVRVEIVEVSEYSAGLAGEQPRAEMIKKLSAPLAGSATVLVENIVDTGLRAAFVAEYLRSEGAASVKVCALWDRPFRRVVPLELRYTGLVAPQGWLVGYGLALDGGGRDLTSVHVSHSEPDPRGG